jgi:AAA15 family ATPase/GTPase
MIKGFNLENFGPLASAKTEALGAINLFLGANSTGKTFLLKALYAMIRAQEEFGRGDDPRDFDEVLAEKFYWTFQTDKLGDLVKKGAGNRLKAKITLDNNGVLALDFGPDTTKKIVPLINELPKREANSIFLPPKEVLSLAKVIVKSALQDRAFGFDATYVDLVLALQNPTQMGKNYRKFSQSRQKLEAMFQGKIEYDLQSEKWVYKKGNSKYSVNATAEGVKKIAILDILLGNRYLSPDSIIFIDEPESALHPSAISAFLEIVELLSKQGIQFFITTHSYFVVKKLYLIALKSSNPSPVFIANDEGVWTQHDLKDGLPQNAIIDEAIKLFDEEMEASNT